MKGFSNTSSKIFYCVLLLGVILCGYIMGSFVHNRAQKTSMVNNSRASLLLVRSTYAFFAIYNKINSKDALTRLSGYYALLDNDLVDVDFFIERYNREKLVATKRTIIWVLQFASEKNKVKQFCVNSYKRASLEVKLEIEKCLKKIDPVYYEEWSKKNKQQ